MGGDCLFSVAVNHSFYIDLAIAGVSPFSSFKPALTIFRAELSCNLFSVYMQF